MRLFFQIDKCPRCSSPRTVPFFSRPVQKPQCRTCTEYAEDTGAVPIERPATRDDDSGVRIGQSVQTPAMAEASAQLLSSVEDLLQEDVPQDDLAAVVVELSAQVGAYQMALLNNEPVAARSFLENVVRIAQSLLEK